MMRHTLDNFSESARQIILFIAILSIPAAIIVWIIYVLGHGETLNCVKLEPKHISCQLEKSHWYGLTSTPTEKFKLAKTSLKMRIETDSEGDSITYYKLVLYDDKYKPIDFYESPDLSFFSDAKSDKNRVDKFIFEADEQESLKISTSSFIRTVKNIINAFIIFIFLGIASLIFSAIGSLFQSVRDRF
ncbi:MAG: hypothetical protein MJK14_08360 [Rivularia sp. ALOHA_DT_140]|nr:hypothetical protein [Rivularia sp. ALOHA_DT_140]